jgi:hypothetical protein
MNDEKKKPEKVSVVFGVWKFCIIIMKKGKRSPAASQFPQAMHEPRTLASSTKDYT